jgi:heme o synthase
MTSQHQIWKSLLALLRFKLSLSVAFSALAGSVYVCHSFTVQALTVFGGVFLCACAASALNQYQERRLDSLMGRTKNRPLPQGHISGRNALLTTFIAGLSGLTLLFFMTPPLAGCIAVFTLFWYNGVYTPLKQKSQFAVLAGAVVGALPPMIGFTAAGGHITIPCTAICLFMYLWQIAHFMLLLRKYGKDFDRAGFPSITKAMNEERFILTLFTWILGTAGSTLLFPLFHIISGAALVSALIIGNCLFVLYFYLVVVQGRKEFEPAPAFRGMYFFQGFILLLLIVDGVGLG